MSVYRYRENGRTPLKLFAASLGVSAIALLAAMPPDGPLRWWVWGVVLVFNAMTLAMVIVNPEHGMDLEDDGILLLEPRRKRRIALNEIERAVILDGSDSTDLVLHLHGGDEVRVHPWGWPGAKRMERELSARGVTVERR